VAYLIILVALFGLLWLVLIRPQRRRQQEQAQLQEVVEPGDEILTAGGIHGTVREVDGEIVHVEIAPNTTIRLDRRAVAAIAHEEEPEPEGEAEAEPAPEAEAEPESEAEPEPQAQTDPDGGSPISSRES
jgi:preprotein translocase subunit YajC